PDRRELQRRVARDAVETLPRGHDRVDVVEARLVAREHDRAILAGEQRSRGLHGDSLHQRAQQEQERRHGQRSDQESFHGFTLSRNPLKARFTNSGRSVISMWLASGMTQSCAPGIDDRIMIVWSSGIASWSAAMTSVGTAIDPSSSGEMFGSFFHIDMSLPKITSP